jgi:hypothetical protein
MLRTILIGLIAAPLALLIVNHFVYGWAGLILCDCKSISVPTNNAARKKLSQSYDIAQMALVLRQNPDYEVNYQPHARRLIVSRTFDGVKYNIWFEIDREVSKLYLSTNAYGYRRGDFLWGGEKCTTPSFWIKRRAYRMIEDFPLNDLQKAEIKQNVRVTREIRRGLF